jgi:DNA-binding MarR family transcriptional regulator
MPRLEAVFERFGIRAADFAVLATLVRLVDERVTQRRLGLELGLSPGTISLRVDRLVRQGLVERRPDPDDARGALVSLTEAGNEMFEASAPEHLANAQALLAGLTTAEREQLGALLGTLLYTLEEPDEGSRLEPELGLVIEGAPVALERRRAVGLPPLTGVLVSHIHPAGVAAASGIRVGDLITSADRRPVRTGHDLRVAFTRARRPSLTLEVVRGSKLIRLQLAAPETRARKGAPR